MTLTLTEVRDHLTTNLSDGALTFFIDAVNADIVRLGGTAYPMFFAGALCDISIVSPAAAAVTQRAFFNGEPVIGDALIQMTETALVEVSYTLAALDAGAVTVTIDGGSRSDRESLSGLADAILEELAFYIVTGSGRIELGFEDAEDADAAVPGRVIWQLAAGREDAARALLTGVTAGELVRFVVANANAGLLMPVAQWQAALDRIALSCLRVAVADEAVVSIMERGADVTQAIEYLAYSGEYRDRLNQVLALTGGYLS